MTTPAVPVRDVGAPDVAWDQWGQAVMGDWWETTADLMWPQTVTTYGRMRHDLQIRAVRLAYTLPIRRATWVLDPDGCRAEVVQRCADALGMGILGDDSGPGPARRRGVIWGRHLRQALGYLTYGHAVFERRYAADPDGFMTLDNLGERMPWTFTEIRTARDGTVQQVVQNTQREPLDARRLVWYVNDQEGANWAGVSPLRSAYGPWLLKHEVIRVHATSIRRFGMGVPWVETPPGGTETQVRQARDYAAGMRAGDQAGAGLPQGFTPHLMGLTGSVPDALAFIEYFDRAIAKAALAGLIELGQTETGSRALGESFLDLFLLSLQAVADEIATTASSGHPGMPGIVTDLVDVNWGPDEPAPRVACTDVGENYQLTAQAISQLVTCGALAADTGLDEWIRKTWRLPAREPGPAPAQPGPPPAGQEGGEGGAPPAPAPPQPGPAGGVQASAAARRLPSLIAAARWQPDQHQSAWEEALTTLLLAYQPVMAAQRRELADQVGEAVSRGRPDRLALAPPGLGDGPGLIGTAMTGMAAEGTRAMLAEAAAQGVTVNPARVKVAAARLGRVAKARAGIAAAWLAQQAGTRALQVAAQGELSQEGADAADDVEVYLAGLSGRELREQLGAALTMAQNAGRMAVLEAAPAAAGPAVYVAAETLDTNTCAACRAVNGTEYRDLASAEAAYPTGGYAHCEGFARCRGTLIAVWGGGEGVPGAG